MTMRCSMPTDLESLWQHLHDDVYWLHTQWIIYEQLFCTSAERVDILNTSASAFFFMVQNVLADDVQMLPTC